MYAQISSLFCSIAGADVGGLNYRINTYESHTRDKHYLLVLCYHKHFDTSIYLKTVKTYALECHVWGLHAYDRR